MEIEIRDFYPVRVDPVTGYLSGTVRVTLVTLKLDILGVFVCRNKGKWFVQLPGQRATHHETARVIRFPFIVLQDDGAQNELMAAIREKAPPFVEKWLSDRPGFIKTPPLKQKSNSNPEIVVKPASATESKKTTSSAVSGGWVDPPPRKVRGKDGINQKSVKELEKAKN